MELSCLAAFCRSNYTKKNAKNEPQPNSDGGTEHFSFQKLFRSHDEVLYCINQEVGYIICNAPQQNLT